VELSETIIMSGVNLSFRKGCLGPYEDSVQAFA
jgi:hypothetical protein